jgi:hypothetical protein
VFQLHAWKLWLCVLVEAKQRCNKQQAAIECASRVVVDWRRTGEEAMRTQLELFCRLCCCKLEIVLEARIISWCVHFVGFELVAVRRVRRSVCRSVLQGLMDPVAQP